MKSSKQKKQPTKNKSPAAKASAKQFVIWGTIILGIVVVVLVTKQRRQPIAHEPTSPTSQAVLSGSTNATAATNQAPPNSQKLIGRWLRPDGGYVIDIKHIDASGRMDAAYLNPKSIHVSKAEATREGSATKVFIELLDVNYPGSTYTLVYVPERDLLAGVYYQALQQQSFEVYFERMK